MSNKDLLPIITALANSVSEIYMIMDFQYNRFDVHDWEKSQIDPKMIAIKESLRYANEKLHTLSELTDNERDG